ncbi:MAG TPA: response regulator [Candidatus Paceibacterota bacterium]|jgi:CheY-like chemotaxis protein|nr:response regulator [Candidatus Paceibacterota bacterium]HOH11214.1 response regulator [Candidatus Paceibacterota bacterium]HOY11408.1 response regulator [Candidatus Paceibacterota bacterium]HPI24754.1 response regulator [Candidatus Paceibacterota bacterium]HPN89482.1 response regulator [Candidatus Paceibacterota bacterium]
MTKKILIVEDDEFLRSLNAKRLEGEGFEVLVAVDGNEALTKLTEIKPDLIFLDLLLPNVDGFEVLTKIKQDETTKNIPVIVFSNLGQAEDIEKAKKLGADDFMVKANFTLDDVISKIKETLK